MKPCPDRPQTARRWQGFNNGPGSTGTSTGLICSASLGTARYKMGRSLPRLRDCPPTLRLHVGSYGCRGPSDELTGRCCCPDGQQAAPEALADRPRPRMSVVCRATCRVRDLRVAYATSGCLWRRRLARSPAVRRPPTPHRGASIPVTIGRTDLFRVAPLHRRDRRCGSARWRAVGAFLQGQKWALCRMRGEQRRLKFMSPWALDGCVARHGAFRLSAWGRARRANRPLGGSHWTRAGPASTLPATSITRGLNVRQHFSNGPGSSSSGPYPCPDDRPQRTVIRPRARVAGPVGGRGRQPRIGVRRGARPRPRRLRPGACARLGGAITGDGATHQGMRDGGPPDYHRAVGTMSSPEGPDSHNVEEVGSLGP